MFPMPVVETVKNDGERKHDECGYEVISKRYDSGIPDVERRMHRHTCDVMKETPKRDESYDLELLPDKLGHRLWQDDNEEEDLVDQNKAKGSIDRLEVVVRLPAIESRYVIEKEKDGEVTKKEENR